MITIRMDYGEEHKYKKAEFFPGFVKVETDKGVKLIPYQQIKHIIYDNKKYQENCCEENGILYLTPYGPPLAFTPVDTKPVTEKSSKSSAAQTKKEVATKKK